MTSTRLKDWLAREQTAFSACHPASRALFESGEQHYLYGTPSHWMRRWAGGFPLYVDRAAGASIRCVDGHEYSDFCLGDTGGMCGHAVPQVTGAVCEQLSRGATLMLPTGEADWVGAELARRFGLPYWGFTTSASDANRAAIRIARMVSGRDAVLVFNGCYHGSVEEAHVALSGGRMIMRSGVHPNAVDHSHVSRVVEFNDAAALEDALERRDVAVVLAEPCMTNYGMIEPLPGFLATLRDLTRRTGTLLLLDETHTLSVGPGGYTGRDRLEPDMLVLGKAVGGGIPVGLYGLSRSVAERMWELIPRGIGDPQRRQSSHLGFGGTLAGSALQVAAVRAVLAEVLTEAGFAHMLALADDLVTRAREVIAAGRFQWCVVQCGARAEIMMTAATPRNAAEVARGRNMLLETLFHLYMLNRGVLITPFHSMLLMCPQTQPTDVDRFIEALRDFCVELGSCGGTT